MVGGARFGVPGSVRSRYFDQRADAHDGFVGGLVPGEHQAQGDEREVRRPFPEGFESGVKRSGAGNVRRRLQKRANHFTFAGTAVEKVAVEHLEVHSMGFAGRALLLFALLLCSAGASPRSPLDRTIERMREAAGVPAAAHIVSLRSHKDGSITVSDRDDSSGMRMLWQHCNDAICFGSYFDGDRLYAVNLNGTALPRAPSEQVYLRGLQCVASGAFLDPAFQRDGGAISDGGEVSLGGRTYRKLNVTARDAVPMETFVDERTELVAMTRDPDEDALFTFRAYRRVGPYLLPFEIDRNGRVFVRYDTRTIVSTAFEPPRGLTPTFGGAPMTLEAKSLSPVGTCEIAGVPARCLIDTGNSGISMSLELAETLHAPVVGAFEVNGLGHYATEVVEAGPLRAGNLTLPSAKYVVLHDIHSYGYDLVLGADVLANAELTLDYDARTASFSAPPADPETSGIALDFENFIPVVPVKLGTLQTRLAVDTGDQSTINVSYDYYMQHRDLFKPDQQADVEGVGGTSVELMSVISSVRVGDFTIDSPNIGTTKTLRGTSHGHLGTGFLDHFRIVLDYARRRLHLFARRGDPAVKESPR